MAVVVVVGTTGTVVACTVDVDVNVDKTVPRLELCIECRTTVAAFVGSVDGTGAELWSKVLETVVTSATADVKVVVVVVTVVGTMSSVVASTVDGDEDETGSALVLCVEYCTTVADCVVSWGTEVD